VRQTDTTRQQRPRYAERRAGSKTLQNIENASRTERLLTKAFTAAPKDTHLLLHFKNSLKSMSDSAFKVGKVSKEIQSIRLIS